MARSFLEGSVEFPGGSNLAPKIEHHKPTLGRSAVSLGCSDLHSNHKFLDILDFSGHQALTTNQKHLRTDDHSPTLSEPSSVTQRYF